jgi:hypothetical protein
MKRPLAAWLGTRMEISRVPPPTVRRITVVWSLGRLTGRPMRPASAIADLLLRGPGPARSRRLEYSRADLPPAEPVGIDARTLRDHRAAPSVPSE